MTDPKALQADESTATILVVDDHSETRKILSRFVAPLGVNLIEAEDGRQALNILKKQHVDVVISDMVMPKMSGIMLLHSMLEQGLHIPFILVTGHSDKDSAIQALRLGAFDYLEKPVDEVDLCSIVQEALSVGREQRQLVSELRTTQQRAVERGQAEMMIMKMRTIRFRGEGTVEPSTPGQTSTWRDLKDLFVQEAGPQLVFAVGALKDLLASENLARDMGFVLRVIQTTRMAAEATRLTDFAEFAWSLEAALGSFKTAPTELTPQHIDVLVAGAGVLLEKTHQLDAAAERGVQDQLNDIAQALKAS
jgi:CheY-like chemotaxis protein